MTRHRFDPLSFLFGAVFLAVGMTFLFAGGFPQIRPSQIWPAAMIAVGLTLGAWAASTALRRSRSETEGVDPHPEASDMPDEDAGGESETPATSH